jgi:hypothetical protein
MKIIEFFKAHVMGLFIKLPENPRLSSLGMNGARSDAR